MNSNHWRLPPSTLHWLKKVPRNESVTVLLRHSVRDRLPPGDVGYELPITDSGKQLARELGTIIAGRLMSLHCSPLARCVQTAEAIRAGASIDIPIMRDRLLGDPGIFVIDERRAWSNWQELGHDGVILRLVSQDEALPGMAKPDQAARSLVQHMMSAAGDAPGLHVFVTHDALITVTAARLLGERLGPDAWPWYLEGAFFWQEGGRICVAYRDLSDSLMLYRENSSFSCSRRERMT